MMCALCFVCFFFFFHQLVVSSPLFGITGLDGTRATLAPPLPPRLAGLTLPLVLGLLLFPLPADPSSLSLSLIACIAVSTRPSGVLGLRVDFASSDSPFMFTDAL